MGVFTNSGTLAFKVSGAKLNTSLSLTPGTYNTTVQEWDNCGGSATTPVTITVSQSAAGGSNSGAPPPSGNTFSTSLSLGAEAEMSKNLNQQPG